MEKMNQKAKTIGMKNTNFVDCTGLHDPEHYSTAYDIALLLRYALHNETFCDVIESHFHSTPGTNVHPDGITYYSTMFKNMSDTSVIGGEVLGGKTGYTDEAGHCLVSYATDADGKQFIAVTAKGPTYWRAVFDTFAIYGLVHDGYPMPDNLAAQETDENGSAIDPTETSTAPAA